MIALARARYWPLPKRAQRWIAEPLSSKRRREQHRMARIEEIARRIMAKDLPESFRLLMGERGNGRH
jgi:hypothetical protein